MENKTVIRLAKKYNLSYKPVLMQNGFTAYLFDFANIEEYSTFSAMFRRCKNLYVDSNIYTHSIFVWDAADHEKAKTAMEYKMRLVNMFYEILHNGGTSKQGKQAQIDYCKMHPEYLPAFDQIYN